MARGKTGSRASGSCSNQASRAGSSRADLIRLAGARRFNRYLRSDGPSATYRSTTIEHDDPDRLGRVRAGWGPGFCADSKGWYPISACSVPMSILTVRELEFLDSLRTGWRVLYCNELARLLKEDDGRCRPRASSVVRQSLVSCDVTAGASVHQISRPLRGT